MNNIMRKIGMAWRKVARKFIGPFHSALFSEVREYTISNIHSKFDHSDVELFKYSYADDLQSESKHIESIMKDIHPDETMFDIGANVGIYTIFIGQILNSGGIIAFEPHRATYDKLIRNIKLNNIENNVTPMNVALSSQTGKSDLIEREPTGHQLEGSDRNGIPVDVYKGSDLIKSGTISEPDILKIDVEGWELEVLKGLNDHLAACRVIYCEIHPNHLEQRGDAPEDILNLLENTGFKITTRKERDNQIHIRAENINT